MDKFDTITLEWFKTNPTCISKVCQCDTCGQYYKPSLGHECAILEIKDKTSTQNIINTR